MCKVLCFCAQFTILVLSASILEQYHVVVNLKVVPKIKKKKMHFGQASGKQNRKKGSHEM